MVNSTRTRVLVAYASAHGSTRDIAQFVGTELARAGVHADVTCMLDDPDPRRYRAVVLGSAMHGQRWLPVAEQYVARHRDALRERPVWMFSVGPTPAVRGLVGRVLSALTPKPVAALRDEAAARGCASFAGVLAPDEGPLSARALYRALGRGRYGDLRDWPRIRQWAARLASDLPAAILLAEATTS